MCIRDRHITAKEEGPWTRDGEFGGAHREVVIRNLKQRVETVSYTHLIDKEVLSIINNSYNEAMQMLTENREILDHISEYQMCIRDSIYSVGADIIPHIPEKLCFLTSGT